MLVREKPDDEASVKSGAPGDPTKDPFCAFWQGDDPRIHAELCSVLEEAEIPYKTIYRKDHLFNLANYPTFQVGVPASLFESAEIAIRDAFSSDGEGADAAELLSIPKLLPDEREDRIRKLPEILSTQENIPGPESPGDTEYWFQQDAIALVWSSEDSYLASAILAALNENDLHVRREMQANVFHLYVLPDEHTRAKEIVREIVQSAAPE